MKLKAKNVGGLLKWALGKSPKFSAFQRKVLGSVVDTVGRGVVVPSTKVKLNEIGMPVEMAWDVYAPFVTRKLVQRNYTPIEAMKMVKSRSRAAFDALQEAVAERPVVMNRAPSLHKLSLMGFNVKLTSGNAIKVNPSIVVPFGMDFDGDTVWNTVRIGVRLEDLNWYLTKSKKGVYYRKLLTKKGQVPMITKNENVSFVQLAVSLSDMPVKKETENRKSDTVTEWEVDGDAYVSTVDPSDGQIKLAKMTHVSRHTGLEMFDVTMDVSGAYSHVVTASKDHSLITLDKNTLDLVKTKPEDSLGALVPRAMANASNTSKVCLKYIEMENQYPLGYEMGMFLGMMVGDGWVDSNNVVRIACCDASLQKYIQDTFAPKTGMPFTKAPALFSYPSDEQRFSKNDKQRFTFYMPVSIAKALKDKIGSGAYNKKIPYECLMASKTHMVGVLCGLLATDGHIGISKTAAKKAEIKNIAYHTTSGLLRDSLQDLCLRLGIKTRVTPYMGANSLSTCYEIGFCLEDIAKLKKKYPTQFVIPVDYKEEALKEICASLEKGARISFDIVPFPRGLFCEFVYAGITNISKDTIISARSKGYIKRTVALRIAEHLEQVDWDSYRDMPCIKKAERTGHTPSQAKALVDKWIAMVRNEDIGWEVVTDVTPSTVTEGWDCTVPGPYTFTLSTGTVVQDTVNLHVPVSQAGIRDVR